MVIERIKIDDREQWLALRSANVNASEVAIVCGEGAYGSLAELYAEKKGLKPPQADSSVLRRGRWGEPAVFEALGETFPQWELMRSRIYLVDRARRMGATPDGFALRADRAGRGIVQAKIISRSVFKRVWLLDEDDTIEHGDAEVPAYYRLQTLAEMRLSESNWGMIAVIINSEFDMRLRVFDIEHDVELEAEILAGVEAFWRDYFDRDIMPPFEPQRHAELIKALYPQDDGTVIDLSQHNRVGELVEQLIETRAAVTRNEAAKAAVTTELRAILGDHTYGKLADGRCLSWKMQTKKGYTVAPSSSRVLKILKEMPRGVNANG